jgi:hypothetical protein
MAPIPGGGSKDVPAPVTTPAPSTRASNHIGIGIGIAIVILAVICTFSSLIYMKVKKKSLVPEPNRLARRRRRPGMFPMRIH